MSLEIEQTKTFGRVVKKLTSQQKQDLDIALKQLIKEPFAGILKKGDLDFVRVIKFKMQKQLALLAYEYDEFTNVITLMHLGSHENFYRDLKRRI